MTQQEQQARSLEAEAEEKGKTDYELNLELEDQNGETVAEVSGTWQIRKLPEGM